MNTSTANQKKKSMSSHSDDLVAKKAWNPGEERARMRYRTDTQPRGIYGKTVYIEKEKRLGSMKDISNGVRVAVDNSGSEPNCRSPTHKMGLYPVPSRPFPSYLC